MEDFNNLVDLKDQMGLQILNKGIEDVLPNATKCMTWQDVKTTHKTDTSDASLVIRFANIYGIISLFALGVGGATLALLIECLSKIVILGFKKS